jgi:hypothetical protein
MECWEAGGLGWLDWLGDWWGAGSGRRDDIKVRARARSLSLSLVSPFRAHNKAQSSAVCPTRTHAGRAGAQG